MSGEVYAAAKASTCCDAVGEESPNGATRKIAAGNFVGSPEGGGTILPCQGTDALFSSLITLHSPSGCCMNSRINPKQTGTGLNPTENTFGGDPGLTPSPLVSTRS